MLAGSLQVVSRHNTDGNGAPTSETARATSWAAAGSAGVTVGAVVAPATASADVLAAIGDGSNVNVAGGDVDVRAYSSNHAISNPLNLAFGGLAGVGITQSQATSSGSTKAILAGSVEAPGNSNGADTVEVIALDTSIAEAEATASAFAGLAAASSTSASSHVEPTVQASVGDGDEIRTAGNIRLEARSVTDAPAYASGATIAAGGAAGSSVAQSNLQPHVHASVGENALLNSFLGTINISATHNRNTEDNGANAVATTSSGGLFVGLSGASATANIELDIQADVQGDLLARPGVSVSAYSENRSNATASGIGVGGLAGVGTTNAAADIGGSQLVTIGDVEMNSGTDVSIINRAESDAVADVASVTGGVFASAGANLASAMVDPTVHTTVANGADLEAGQDLRLVTSSLGDATASTTGVGVAGGVSFTGSASQATLDADVATIVGVGQFKAGRDLLVHAFHNASAGGVSGDNAEATASASGGAAVAAASGAIANATATAQVHAALGGSGAKIQAGSGRTEVYARNSNDTLANADGVTLAGVVGVGANLTNAESSGETTAELASGSQVMGHGLEVEARSTDLATAISKASAGGILGSGDATAAAAVAKPSITSTIGSGVDAELTGDVLVSAQSTTETDSLAEGKALAGGVSGGSSNALAVEDFALNSSVGSQASIVTEGAIQVLALHNDKISVYNGAFDGATDVNLAANSIDLPGLHGLSSGDRVTYSDDSGTTIGGLADGQSYAVFVVDENRLRLGQTFSGPQVDAQEDVIRFTYTHGLETGQRVFYTTNNNPGTIGGLANGNAYFVRVIDAYTIKLYSTALGANSASLSFNPQADLLNNQITLPAHGLVDNQAVTYEAPANQEFAGAWINPQDHSISFASFVAAEGDLVEDHGFQSGDLITYQAEGQDVTGLVNGGQYYVVRLDASRLQLATDAEGSDIIEIANPDQNNITLHRISMANEIPLANLQSGRTYYVDLVDANTIALRNNPDGPAINLNSGSVLGSHGIRPAGVEISSGGVDSLHGIYVDLTAVGNGTQHLVGAGGALGSLAQATRNGISSANSLGSAGSIIGSLRRSNSVVNLDGQTNVAVGSSAELQAGTNLEVIGASAVNSGGTARSKAISGIAAGGSGEVTIDSNNQVHTNVGLSAILHAGQELDVEALTINDTLSATDALGVSGLSGARAETNAHLWHDTRVDIADRANLTSDGNIGILAEMTFGGDLTNRADSGGFGTAPRAHSRYYMGQGDALQDTVVQIGNGASIKGKREVQIRANVDNDGRINSHAEANAYGVFAVTNATNVIEVRSNANVFVDNNADVVGRDALLVTTEHEPISTYSYTEADSRALAKSTAEADLTVEMVSTVEGEDNAVFSSGDLQVRSLVGENVLSRYARARGVPLISDANIDVNTAYPRVIDFDSDVVLLPSPDPELVVDENGVVTVARGITVNGGFGEGYHVPATGFVVDDISNNAPGHALFETNSLDHKIDGTIVSDPNVTRGVFYVEHAFDHVLIENHSSSDMRIRHIRPIDRDGVPAPRVDIVTDIRTLEFNIANRISETEIQIDNFGISQADVRLDGVIDNPIGSTHIRSESGDLLKHSFNSDQLIRSNLTRLDAGGSIGQAVPGAAALRIRVDEVQSAGRPENLDASAGDDLHLAVRGVLRDPAVQNFVVNVGMLQAGDWLDLQLLKPIRETDLAVLPNYVLVVDQDLKDDNPPAQNYVRYFDPDQVGPAIIAGPLHGVFGSNAVEIDGTYDIELAKGKDVDIFVVSPGECIIHVIVVIQIIPDPINGFDLLASGDITIAPFGSGELPDGRVNSAFGSVLVTGAGDANLDGLFDSSDLVRIFQEGQYEDGITGNSTWRSGDWNGDGEFDTSDLVTAFQLGWYEQGPRRPLAAVQDDLFADIALLDSLLDDDRWGSWKRK
ncbi:MAG: hypothetical protein R3C28_24930 [Pirellulaceae bacterium]